MPGYASLPDLDKDPRLVTIELKRKHVERLKRTLDKQWTSFNQWAYDQHKQQLIDLIANYGL